MTDVITHLYAMLTPSKHPKSTFCKLVGLGFRRFRIRLVSLQHTAEPATSQAGMMDVRHRSSFALHIKCMRVCEPSVLWLCVQASGAAYPFKKKDARLVLENGSVWHGTAFGAKGTEVGEVVFNTSITGACGGVWGGPAAEGKGSSTNAGLWGMLCDGVAACGFVGPGRGVRAERRVGRMASRGLSCSGVGQRVFSIGWVAGCRR